MNTTTYDLYEIANTFTSDLSLDTQIRLGICDWQLDCPNGHCYFGHTRVEAIDNAKMGGF